MQDVRPGQVAAERGVRPQQRERAQGVEGQPEHRHPVPLLRDGRPGAQQPQVQHPDVVVAGGGAHVPGDERRLPGPLRRRVPGADDEHAHGAQPLPAPVRPGTASDAVPDAVQDGGPDAVPGTVLDGVGAAIMVPPYRRGHGRGAPGTAPGRE